MVQETGSPIDRPLATHCGVAMKPFFTQTEHNRLRIADGC